MPTNFGKIFIYLLAALPKGRLNSVGEVGSKQDGNIIVRKSWFDTKLEYMSMHTNRAVID